MRIRRWAWRLSLLTVAAGASLGAIGAWLMRPAHLESRLNGFLASRGLPPVTPDILSFTPWDGLVVQGVTLRLEDASVTVRHARILCDWRALLAGRFEPIAIDLSGLDADIHLRPGSLDRDGDLLNQLIRLGADAADWPKLDLRAADVRLHTHAENDRTSSFKRFVLDISGAFEASTDIGAAYRITARQVGGPRLGGPRSAAAAPLIEVALASAEVLLRSDWTDLGWIVERLPVAARGGIEGGRGRIERCVWRSGRLVDLALIYEDLIASVAVESETWHGEPYLRVRHGSGVLRVSHQPEGVKLAGELRGDLIGGSGALWFEASGATDAAWDTPAWLAAARAGEWSLERGNARVEVSGLHFPHPDRHAGFIASPRLPGPLRAFLDDYEPSGAADFEARVVWSENVEGGRTVVGELRPRDAKLRYFRFPYLAEQVNGRIRFSPDGIHIDRLDARHGTARLACTAHLQSTDNWTGFTLRVTGRDVPLNRDLYDALPDEYRQLWRTTNPVGTADVEVNITRAHGSAETGRLEPRIDTRARLRSASVTVDGQRLHDASGLLWVRGDQIEVSDLHARRGAADVTLSGELARDEEDGEPDYSFSVAARRMPFDYLATPLAHDGAELGSVYFEGMGDVRGRRTRDAHGSYENYRVELLDGVLRGFSSDVTWSAARGRLHVTPERIFIERLRAGQDGSWIELAGTLPRDAQRHFDFIVRAGGARLQDLLGGLTPQRWSNLREALGLSGIGQIEARFTGATHAGGGENSGAIIDLRAAAMRPEALPLDLRDVLARIAVNMDGFELRTCAARLGDSRIEVLGRGGWGKIPWTQLEVNFDQLDVTPEFRRAMPRGLRSLLEQTAASGRIATTVEKLRIGLDESGVWTAGGRLTLSGAALQVGLTLENLEGELVGEVRAPPETHAAVASRFTIDHAMLGGRPIRGWQGQLEREAGARELRIEGVSGHWCGGGVAGFGSLDTVTQAYELSITLNGIDLDEFSRQPGEPPPAGGVPGRARLDGRIFLRGVAGDESTRVGGGDLRISGASLLSSPVTAGLVSAGRGARRAVNERVDAAEVRFAWRGSRLEFSEVHIRTRETRLIGVGWFDTQRRWVDLTMVAAPPQRIRNLAVVSDLVDLARAELAQYRIEGPVEQPRITIEPLHNLGGPLRQVFERLGG